MYRLSPDSLPHHPSPDFTHALPLHLQVLKVADQQVSDLVDSAVNTASYRNFSEAREAYLKKVEETVESVRKGTKVDATLDALITNVQEVSRKRKGKVQETPVHT
jgi:hypothetical protein